LTSITRKIRYGLKHTVPEVWESVVSLIEQASYMSVHGDGSTPYGIAVGGFMARLYPYGMALVAWLYLLCMGTPYGMVEGGRGCNSLWGPLMAWLYLLCGEPLWHDRIFSVGITISSLWGALMA
jgi:hypothetical protein